ncbi:uncharacterized protein UTRI_01505 [Ustilago trichophora]|uniref:Uncharacterized protein n=1 Tax=Ustilago trichophora TaxID=86804 RepID=A0A5C3DZW4_9BASI|nr:uncharacterized protein UTRI_01505 [Ustilago trichophora]
MNAKIGICGGEASKANQSPAHGQCAVQYTPTKYSSLPSTGRNRNAGEKEKDRQSKHPRKSRYCRSPVFGKSIGRTLRPRLLAALSCALSEQAASKEDSQVFWYSMLLTVLELCRAVICPQQSESFQQSSRQSTVCRAMA